MKRKTCLPEESEKQNDKSYIPSLHIHTTWGLKGALLNNFLSPFSFFPTVTTKKGTPIWQFLGSCIHHEPFLQPQPNWDEIAMRFVCAATKKRARKVSFYPQHFSQKGL
jgi:hypothetical protein